MKGAILAAVSCLAFVACGGPESEVGSNADVVGLQNVSTPEASCLASGGTVKSSSCCAGVTGFPKTCLVGACGCSPANSHAVPTCACPRGTCFDGSQCVVDPYLREQSCRASGGTVVTSLCCGSVGDFPNGCLAGACGCAPAASHPVRTCLCPPGKCFDGSACVGR